MLNPHGRGVANAIRAGVEAASAPWVLVGVCDDPGWIVAADEMMALAEGGCDLVNATRYAHGGLRFAGSRVGWILSRLANWLFQRFAGCVLTDPTTGIKLFRRTDFASFGLDPVSAGWASAFEMSIKAQMRGMKLGETPIVSVDRMFGGTSTFRPGAWIVAYLRWFVWGVIQLRRAGRRQPAVIRRGS